MADTAFLSDADFELYKTLIYNESGILFTATNRSILEQRLRDILRENKMAHVRDYYAKALRDREELKRLLTMVTTNLTRFFRNQPHFDAFEKFVIPETLNIKKPTGNYTIKIWSAGCSTGEEPYTIAMLLAEILPSPWKYDIIASDLSLKCLMTAKEGFYDGARVVGVPDNYLKKYFDVVQGGYKVKNELKSHVRFDYHNLKNDAGMRGIDICFCRNVLIYFDQETQTNIVNKFYDSMNEKSFLYIGHSESLFGMNTKFAFLKTEWTTLYKKG
ncbi:MAG: protein-glutamate O-methyltransferase CheR [Spirochaetaceae bacterium]|jgi:chemotaxis protein methyltransferase CheR|nr:protein-glutamate O-methyltransferase CheR [Spirochaetaceae bacterium]